MNRPVVWAIAGTDPSAGAGIQADLKTVQALGGYACTVITAVIAQNTQRVAMIEFPSDKMLAAQLRVLQEDVPPIAIKIGMLGTAATVRGVVEVLEHVPAFVVYDPVMSASAGARLMEPSACKRVLAELLPRVGLITPNLAEAEALLERPVRTVEEMETAAQELVERGAQSALLKGGHLERAFCQDFWTDGRRRAWLTSPRQETPHTHGSGCTLSSAIATAVALGYDVLDAVVIGKAYVNQGLRLGGGIGRGRGPLAHEGWPSAPEDLPWITPTAEAGLAREPFAECGEEPLGFYPLVDSAAWVERLARLGVRTIQLRLKDRSAAEAEREIQRATEVVRERPGVRLFVNDFWAAALRHGAYGVHLGMEDLEGADLEALRRGGLRLGVSVHGYAELARAAAVRPSYVSLGTVFDTASKRVPTAPLGLERFAALRRLAPARAVAIGGCTLERAPALRAAGADGIAVISDLRDAPDPDARVKGWLAFWR